MNRHADEVKTVEDADVDDDEEPVWAGPGLYWGVYISNENEYWDQYNRRYENRRMDRRERRAVRRSGESH